MRSTASRFLSNPTSYSRYADLETDKSQDAWNADNVSLSKMTGVYAPEQDRHSSSSYSFAFSPNVRYAANLSSLSGLILGFLVACTWIRTASALMVPFDNCLDHNYIYTDQPADQVQLQWVPLYVDAEFDTVNPNHNLRVTVYGM